MDKTEKLLLFEWRFKKQLLCVRGVAKDPSSTCQGEQYNQCVKELSFSYQQWQMITRAVKLSC